MDDTNKIRKRKGYFSISAVAQMFAVHQQTIRLYEKEGLINPKRTAGNTRMFSEEDINRLEEVIYLTHKLGINLAGVEMILKLQKQIKKLQKDVNTIFEQTDSELSQQIEESKKTIKGCSEKLFAIKAPQLPPVNTYESQEAPTVDRDNWEIDYEDS